MTKNILFCCGVLILFSNIIRPDVNGGLDSLVISAIKLSEKSLYSANFDEAKNHLESLIGLNDNLSISLLSQRNKIQLFENYLSEKSYEQKFVLNNMKENLQIAETISNKETYAEFLNILATAFFYNGFIDSAKIYYNKSLALFVKLNNEYKTAELRAAVLLCDFRLFGDKDDMAGLGNLVHRYEEEIKYGEKINNKLALSYSTRHLGFIYESVLKDFDKAEEMFEYSLKLREEINFIPYISPAYSTLGDFYTQRNKNDSAIEMYTKSIESAETSKFIRYQFHPRIKIGDIYLNEGNIDKAKHYYDEALKNASENNYARGIEIAAEKLKAIN